MKSKAMRPEPFNVRWGDVLNALLAITLAGLAYWQGEIGLNAVRDHIGKVRTEVNELKRDLNALRQDSQRVTRSTQRIDGTTRELLKEQQRQRRDTGTAFRWSW